jgi:outer membrane biosynthesis protein TonB
MAGNSKDTRSERDSQSLVADLLRRATSPEVLAGVAGAAAAARFTKHMVEHSDEADLDEQPAQEETDEAYATGEDEPDHDEEEAEENDPEEPRAEEDEPDEDEQEEPRAVDDEPDDDEREEPQAAEEEDAPEAAAEPESADSDEDDPTQDEDSEQSEETSDSSAASNGSPGTDDERMELLDRARRYAEQLTGHPVESFSSLEQDDRGWRIGVEVVELSRVPSTTDVLGSYELVLTDDGEFVDFRRDHRYSRNSTDDAS